MNLDVSVRSKLAANILRRLQQTFPSSQIWLRGSLAEGRSDEFSDIDVQWEVLDEDFERCVDVLRSTLESIRPVESLRSDPDFQKSRKRRLFFVRFQDVPLFWRLDLAVFAKSIDRNEAYDVDNPDARGSDWSKTESALANVVASVKAHLRNNDQEARGLLMRAYERVGLVVPDLGLYALADTLVDEIILIDPQLAPLGKRIKELVDTAFRQGRRAAAGNQPLDT